MTSKTIQTCGWNERYCTCYMGKSLCSYPKKGQCLIYNYAASVFGHKKNKYINLLQRMQTGWERELDERQQ